MVGAFKSEEKARAAVGRKFKELGPYIVAIVLYEWPRPIARWERRGDEISEVPRVAG